MKTLVIVTSVIEITSNPFDYTAIRSVYTPEDRFTQTIHTINSLNKIQDKAILFIETSNISKEKEKKIKSLVDFYVNFNDNPQIKEVIDGSIKGKAEATQIFEGLKLVNLEDYDSIIKISGRYYLGESFDAELFSENISIFKESESKDALSTVLYRIKKENFDLYKETLNFCLGSSGMLESNFFKFFKNQYIVPQKLGVNGNVSVDGTYIQF